MAAQPGSATLRDATADGGTCDGGERRAMRRLWSVLAGVALLASIVPAAHAAPLEGCSGQSFERPFLRWLDPVQYTLAPGGALESESGWSLDGDAELVPGNELFQVHSAADAHSLALPPRSSATTDWMCVGLEHPTLRFFARNDGSLLAPLEVEVLFRDVTGGVRALPVSLVVAGKRWQPTLPILLLANVPDSLASLDGYTSVAFRFTPLGRGGDWQIDDVYVDPFRGR
jgi:hypothetical protein